MAARPPDLVDSVQLAEQGAVLERGYALAELPRLADLLANGQGAVRARFAFSILPSGRPGASVEVQAEPCLRCQRCMGGFARQVAGRSRVEFAADEAARACDAEHEIFRAPGGRVSLKDLAEEELLLALPIVPACESPEDCGNAPGSGADAPIRGEAGGMDDDGSMRRPFGELKELLKKRDRT